jgi:vanillate O-demethylase monooxygenase subunit
MTRYLRNAWYAVAFSDEVADRPLGRTLLGTELVVYRDSQGKAVILYDRCPHRFAPLSLGKVVGNDLQCPYHGLQFDATGSCTRNPHSKDARPLKAARVPAFPALERYGVIWYWPGESSLASEAMLPRIEFLEQREQFGIVKGYLNVKSNYQLIVDNLLDLSHASFIHPEFASGAGISPEQSLAATTIRLERRERSLRNYRMRSGLPAPRPSQMLFGFDATTPTDAKTHMTWHPPGLLDFDAGVWVKGAPEEEGAHIPQLHVISPETEFTSHYFFINGRNRRIGDAEVDTALLQMFDRAFRQQDEPMIEKVQERMGAVSDIDQLRPVLLATDEASVTARRILAKLIAEEQSSLATGTS